MDNKHVVGRPNLGNRDQFRRRLEEILDSRWLSNYGPMVRKFEAAVAKYLGVQHVVAVCNATAGIELAIRALELSGEVIVPSYTFVATAHALRWQGITPIFCDVDPLTHNIDPSKIEALITAETTGILGVHLWGRSCDTDALSDIADRNNLGLMFDASHGFGCSKGGLMLGNFGECEVFSFHATKFINALEGGVVATNNAHLAQKIRDMSNFGFTDYDTVEYLGINAKMNEVSAAMGLTNLEALDEIVAVNYANYQQYHSELAQIRGVSVIKYDEQETNNYQYVVIEVDPDACSLDRDGIMRVLHSEGILARRYFWPGCHNMQPYRSEQPQVGARLEHTNTLSSRVLVLPTGQTVDCAAVGEICQIIAKCAGGQA